MGNALSLEELAQASISTANGWDQIAFANVLAFEQHGPDYDGAVPPFVAAQIARDRLMEAGLYELVGVIVTPAVNYQQ